jgi:hypothetical protein
MRVPLPSLRGDIQGHFATEAHVNRLTLITVAFLVGVVVFLVAALYREAASGPTFRAEDHATYGECIRGIPIEWLPNSLERQGAETACLFVHQRPGPGR